jgi:hypothetical protein
MIVFCLTILMLLNLKKADFSKWCLIHFNTGKILLECLACLSVYEDEHNFLFIKFSFIQKERASFWSVSHNQHFFVVGSVLV